MDPQSNQDKDSNPKDILSDQVDGSGAPQDGGNNKPTSGSGGHEQ